MHAFASSNSEFKSQICKFVLNKKKLLKMFINMAKLHTLSVKNSDGY